jgi:hypothetical protein
MNRLPLTLKYRVVSGKLVPHTEQDTEKMKLFNSSLPEGTTVEVTFEVQNTDHSYAQLSKLHKCIREVANFTGNTFEDMKLMVKERAGLLTDSQVKSFAECSKEELNLAIQAVIEIGNLVDFPLQ